MKKRTLSLILVCLMLLPAIAGCSESQVNPADNTQDTTDTSSTPTAEESAAAEGEQKLLPDIPALNFEDRTFTFLTSGVNDTNGVDWETYDIWVESMNGEVINDTVFERNLYLEDTYKVKIAEYKTDGTTLDEIKTEVTANTGAFDAAMTHIENGANLSQGGFLYNLYTVPYIDTAKPWWDQRAVEDLEIVGKLYFATGDITVIDNDATWVLMFGKQLREDLQMPNFYDLVREDKWYYDTFLDLASQGASDLNGDGALKWKDDQYGFITSTASAHGLLYASGEKLAYPDPDKVLVAVSDIERLSGVIEKATAIMSNKDFTFQTGYESTGSADIRHMFEEGRGLFFGEVMQCIIRMRASETDFGLIPWPKYDDTQNDYYTWIHSTAGRGVVIPSSQDDLEFVGAIIEAMAAESMYTVTPAYYDVSLTYKYMRDADSAEMLDIILQSRVYDLAQIYNFGTISSSLNTNISNGSANFASTWKAFSKPFTKIMDKAIENYRKLED